MTENNKLPFTGERIVTEFVNHVGVTEHLHRYAIAQELCKDKDVLDIACGEGYGSNLLSIVAKKVVGVDIAEEAVVHAQQKYKAQNLSFIKGSADRMPVSDHSMDVVVSFETLEHHDKHEEMFVEIKRVLRKDGILIMSSPEKSIYFKRDPENPYHIKELTLNEFKELNNKYFTFNTFLTQKFIHGSLIIPVEADEGGCFKSYSGDYYEINDNLQDNNQFYNQPYFNIVIASDIKLNFPKSTFFDGGHLIDEYRATVEEEKIKLLKSTSYKLGNKIVSFLKKIPFLIKFK